LHFLEGAAWQNVPALIRAVFNYATLPRVGNAVVSRFFDRRPMLLQMEWVINGWLAGLWH
jgi:hypothetical protein